MICSLSSYRLRRTLQFVSAAKDAVHSINSADLLSSVGRAVAGIGERLLAIRHGDLANLGMIEDEMIIFVNDLKYHS